MTTGRVFTSGTDGGAPSLLDYLNVLSRRKWTFLATFLLVPLVAVAISLRQTPVYEATADVLLKPPTASDIGGVQTGTVDPARFAETQALLARVPDVAQAALGKVPEADLTVEQFLKKSGVAPTLGSDYLTFSFQSSDSDLATALATAYAEAFTAYSLQNQLEPYRDHLADVRRQLNGLEAVGETHTTAYKDLAEDERQLSAQVDFPQDSAQVVRQADKAFQIAPRTKRNGGIAVILGLMRMPVTSRSGECCATILSASLERVAVPTTWTPKSATTCATVSSQSGCSSTSTVVRFSRLFIERAAFRPGRNL